MSCELQSSTNEDNAGVGSVVVLAFWCQWKICSVLSSFGSGGAHFIVITGSHHFGGVIIPL